MQDTQKIAVNDVSPKTKASVFNPGDQDNYDLYQKREKIYQRYPSGFFQTLRIATIWVTLGVYFLGPWLSWDGRQAILFDLPERKFYIFGFTFWPQDFLLLAWLLIIAAFALFFFTALAGRVWCGYTCPQTVWTTFFMWIEHVTEGDRHQRIRLDAQPWSKQKIIKKTTKHSAWFALAFFTGFTFVGYFAPIKELGLDLLYFEAHAWSIFWLAFFSIATYANAGWLREQVCMYMCPYARFQSVMFDRDTLIVTYDEKRGEPRGSRKKKADISTQDLGSCIDCKMCVQVCPTGIDIRNGLQYECIGCAACIDACDMIMEKMDYPKGLIRYSTENAIEGKKSNILRPRLIAYGAVLMVMVITFFIVLFGRVPLEMDIIRDRNQLYRTTDTGSIENAYTLKIMNKTQDEKNYSIALTGLDGLHLDAPESIRAIPGELVSLSVTATLSPELLTKPNNTIEFHLKSIGEEGLEVIEESRFIGPMPAR